MSQVYRPTGLSLFYFLVARYGLLSVVVNGLSAPSVQPASKNPDAIRSYVLGDESTRCWELLSPSISTDENEEEDEVEYWYSTSRRYFEFSVPHSLSPSSCTTTIRQTSFGCGKLGGELWDSSVALCLYLGQLSLVQGKRILELGSGCGLPSVFCRDELGAGAVLATDFWQADDDEFDKERLVPTKFHGMNLEYNVVKNNINRGNGGKIEATVQRLDWHDLDSAVSARNAFRPDLIIGSDLIYYLMDVEPLLNVLETLLVGESDTKTRAVLVLPLAPAEREALPEFRSKLPARLSSTHIVKMEEIYLLEETDEKSSTFLTIDIIPK